MSIKIDPATHGPSWVEVILGAFLSVVLGAALGFVLLALRPVTTVKTMPKEADRDPKAVYYVEGSRDGTKGRQAAAKRKAFAEGQSVMVIEDELNALAAAASAAPKTGGNAKAAEKGTPPAPTEETFATGTLNFRMHENALQIGVPVTLTTFGLNQKFIVQTRGGFVKQGDAFVYQPSDFYVGSCPVQRLPLLAGYLRGKFLKEQLVPEDIKSSWAKLTNVSIEGNALKLTMP